MIRVSYPRLGLLVGKALLEILSQEAYQVTYRKLIREFQTQTPTSERMYFQQGRSKVDDSFPSISLEIKQRQDAFAATDYTKELTFRFDITVAVKALSAIKATSTGETNQVEQYIITLAEFVLEVLNEPLAALQYTVTTDQEGAALAVPFKIYDSLADTIDYGHLYNGALRIAKISWQGKILRLGPAGTPLQPGY